MKKLLSILLALAVFLPLSFASAKSNNISFFDVLDNMNKLESYNINQGFHGNFSFDDDDVKMDGMFRLSLNGAEKYSEAFQANSKMKVDGLLRLNYKGGDPDEKPFDHLIANVQAEIVSVFNEGIYMKLDHIDVKSKGLPSSDKEEIDKMIEEANAYKGIWYFLPMSVLTAGSTEIGEEFGENFLDPAILSADLQEQGVKKTMQGVFANLMDQYQQDALVDEKDVEKIAGFIDYVLNAKYFVERKVMKGHNAEFTAFRLDKPGIVALVKNIAKNIDEPISLGELNELKRALSKFDLLGMYRLDDQYGIADVFSITFHLKNIEELKRLNVSYRYKISDINKNVDIKAPSDFVEIESDMLPFPLDTPTYELEEGWE